MRIAVFGAGGIGGYLGAKLAQAGDEVALIARGPHLSAIQAHGLFVDSPTGDFHMTPSIATDRPEDVGVVDAVMHRAHQGAAVQVPGEPWQVLTQLYAGQ